MHIKKGENKFFIGEDELNPEAEIVFDIDDDGDYVIQHTEVQSDLSGQGAGSELVDTMLEFISQEDKKVTVNCSFAKSIIDKNGEYKQLLK